MNKPRHNREIMVLSVCLIISKVDRLNPLEGAGERGGRTRGNPTTLLLAAMHPVGLS